MKYIALFSLFFCLAFSQASAVAAVLSRTAIQYNPTNVTVTNTDVLPLIQAAGNLSGWVPNPNVPSARPDVKGWFEYNVIIDTAGWYELLVSWNTDVNDYQGGKNGYFYPYTKYIVNTPDIGMIYLNAAVPPSSVSGFGVIKPGNVWLDVNLDGTPKTYAIRFEKYVWIQSFPPITGFELKPIAADFAINLRVTAGEDESLIGHRYVGVNEDLPIDIEAGGNNVSGVLVVEVWKKGAVALEKSFPTYFYPSAKPVRTRLNVTAPGPGSYYLKYYVDNREVPQNVNLPPLPFTAIDVTPATAPANTVINKGTPLTTINCATTEPDYVGGVDDTAVTPTFKTRVVTTVAGLTYRETANTGFADTNVRQPSPGAFNTWSNYFAYTLPVALTKGQMYLLEVDYPDDADRSFLMEIRQGGGKPYQIRASGVDTGGSFPPTMRMNTHQIFFWPDSTESPRAVVLNYQNGMRAAASKIRLYKVTGELPWLLGAGNGAGRSYGHWFEEPYSFNTSYSDGSIRNLDPLAMVVPIERWAKMLKYVGGDTMWITASVYGDILFPSRDYQKEFGAPNSADYFKMILLVAKKYGLKVVAEVHPRPSNELLNKFSNTSTPNRHLAVNKDGNLYNVGGSVDSSTTPVYNPIYPDNQSWLVGMLREFVLRYKTETAFRGISIRTMGWQNAGLNNFHNMDWGYDGYTASQFALNGGPGDPGSPVARYNTFTGSFYLDAWKVFRVRQINLIYTKLRDALISDPDVRPNNEFEIFSSIFMTGQTQPLSTTVRPDRAAAGLRDSNITGFRYMNRMSYGRRWADPVDWASDRLELTNVSELGEFASSRSYMTHANYAEDGGWTVPNLTLGLTDFSPTDFPPGNPWASGHIVPAGRFNLERYALIMANGDATTIMNGGNNYFVDQAATREFLKEYKQLPTDLFNLAPGSLTTSNAVVRQLTVGGNTSMFYVVNRTNATKSAVVRFSANTIVTRSSNGASASTTNKNLRISLKPFGMAVYRISGRNSTILGVTTN